MQKLVIPVLLTLLAQVGFAKPEPTSSQRENSTAQTSSVEARTSQVRSEAPVTEEIPLENYVNCEVVLTGHWPQQKAAMTLHNLVANQEFRIYSGQGDPHLLAAFGLEKLKEQDFHKLRIIVTENPNMHNRLPNDGDYRIQFFVGNSGFLTSAIAFDAPPIFVWLSHGGGKKGMDAEMKKRGIHPSQIMQPDDLDDRMYGVRLKSRNDVNTYLIAFDDTEENVRYVELGAYLPCNSPRLRGAEETAYHLTSEGWKCKTPLLRLRNPYTPEPKASGLLN